MYQLSSIGVETREEDYEDEDEEDWPGAGGRLQEKRGQILDYMETWEIFLYGNLGDFLAFRFRT